MSVIENYATATATELVAALKAKQVSSVDVTETAIARIEAMDGAINAVVVRDFDHARKAAAAADVALAAGGQGALLGLPMTVKESYDLAGFPTTWGLEIYRDHRAETDSVVVQRLRAAGAVILGKTNVPPSLADWHSANPIYGHTVNPLNPDRSPGGSSGGSAAALAAGFTSLEMGSDIGGSIRIPAAFCGVYGHKPSYGVVPLTGHTPGGQRGAKVALSCAGPLARSAQDLDLALGVVAGPDGEDSPAYSLRLPPPRHDRLSDYRVLVLDSHPRCATSADIADALDGLAGRLERAGAKVARECGLLPDPAISFDVYLQILLTITTRRPGGSDGRPPISSHHWLELLDRQARLRTEWQAVFDLFDVVVAPTFSRSAIPHQNEPDWRKRHMVINGEETPYGDGLVWPSVALLPNLPSTAMPLGLASDGMPISAQVIGPYLGDRTTIAFAGLCAQS